MPRLSINELTGLATHALQNAGASPAMARATARALVAAEAAGLAGHGLSRVALYAQHVREGRAAGATEPRIVHEKGAACLIDAQGGLAYLAMELATREAIRRATEFGVAFCGVTRSHHCGAMDYHLAPLAAAGMVGIGFTNTPAAINAWGGRKPLFGTNPIAAVFPRYARLPLVIDLSLTEVARGKIMLYAREGKPIPPGWAVDKEGRPTTDAKAALTGARFGLENDSFFEPGRPASIGHALLAINLGALAGSDVYFERVETWITAMLADEDVRLPGDRRHESAADACASGIEITDAMLEKLRELAA
ncbi:MAG: Ldh family oxidoreductase [Betaproteobacteria bacterium]|nr:Ldh family oxidoreductase [Betaproteobacteria bacterium]